MSVERLTERNRVGRGVCAAKCSKVYPFACMGCDKAYDAFERLATYEDTGRAPDEIAALDHDVAMLKQSARLANELAKENKALKTDLRDNAYKPCYMCKSWVNNQCIREAHDCGGFSYWTWRGIQAKEEKRQ